MDDLTARIREVHVIVEGDIDLPQGLPPEWLNIKAAGSVVSFVETRFDEAQLRSKVPALLGAVRRIDIRPVDLRSIFTTIARSIKKEAA